MAASVSSRDLTSAAATAALPVALLVVTLAVYVALSTVLLLALAGWCWRAERADALARA
jgi:hypothetical protein